MHTELCSVSEEIHGVITSNCLCNKSLLKGFLKVLINLKEIKMLINSSGRREDLLAMLQSKVKFHFQWFQFKLCELCPEIITFKNKILSKQKTFYI